MTRDCKPHSTPSLLVRTNPVAPVDKILPPEATPETKEEYLKKVEPLMELPLNSEICDPANGTTVQLEGENSIRVRGYALGSHGKSVHLFAKHRETHSPLSQEHPFDLSISASSHYLSLPLPRKPTLLLHLHVPNYLTRSNTKFASPQTRYQRINGLKRNSTITLATRNQIARRTRIGDGLYSLLQSKFRKSLPPKREEERQRSLLSLLQVSTWSIVVNCVLG